MVDIARDPRWGRMAEGAGEDGETFVHSHPADDVPSPGRLQFLARLPKPGLYRGWLQFQRAGKVETTELTLRAEDAK